MKTLVPCMILIVFVSISSSTVYGQFNEQKQKYWIYKERLQNFMIPTSLVSENGFDIPGRRREVKATLYGSEKSIELYLYLDTNDHQQNYKASQSTKQLNSGDSIRSHFAIKFNPIQWLWDEYRFFVELPICDKGSLNFRLGFNNASFLPTESRHTKTDYQYWNSSINSYDTINYSSNGYCLGIGYNYYFGKNNYIQPSFMFKEYWYEFSTLDHWLDAAGNAFWYESEREHRDSFHKKVYSFEIRYGKIFYIHKMLIDLFGGCGVRYKWRKMSIMNEYGVNYESENANSVQTMRTPSLFLGLNIGFVLK